MSCWAQHRPEGAARVEPLKRSPRWMRVTRGDYIAFVGGILGVVIGLAITLLMHNTRLWQYAANGFLSAGVAVFLIGMVLRVQMDIQAELETAIREREAFQAQIRSDVALIERRLEQVIAQMDKEYRRVLAFDDDERTREIRKLRERLEELEHQRRGDREKRRRRRRTLLADRPNDQGGQRSKGLPPVFAAFAVAVLLFCVVGVAAYLIFTRVTAPPTSPSHISNAGKTASRPPNTRRPPKQVLAAFVGTDGTHPPATMLGPFKMTPFVPPNQSTRTAVSSISDPLGSVIKLSPDLALHRSSELGDVEQ